MTMMLLLCSIFCILTFNVYANQLHGLFDTTQFDTIYDRNGHDIEPHSEWNSVIHLKSNTCLDPNFQLSKHNKDVSILQIIVPTPHLLKVWNNENYSLRFKVYCDGKAENHNDYEFHQDGVNLDGYRKFTSFKVKVGKCRGTKKRNINGIELQVLAVKGAKYPPITFNRKSIYPLPNCERITNFKTIKVERFIQELSYNPYNYAPSDSNNWEGYLRPDDDQPYVPEYDRPYLQDDEEISGMPFA